VGDPARPLLLFRHGFPAFWVAWDAVPPALQDRFYAVAPDRRGYALRQAVER